MENEEDLTLLSILQDGARSLHSLLLIPLEMLGFFMGFAWCAFWEDFKKGYKIKKEFDENTLREYRLHKKKKKLLKKVRDKKIQDDQMLGE